MTTSEFLKGRLELHTKHKKYTTGFFKKYGLKKFVVYKNIFRPDCSPITMFMCKYLIKNKEIYINKHVCDLGCGSGIYTIIMAKYGASKVTAIDILNTAIQNVRQNIRLHNLKNVSSRRSNLFQNIEENKLFDLIITNFPIFLNDGRDGFNLFTDKKTVNRIFKNCKSHLKKNGKIILPYTQINDLKTIDYKKEALKNGFNFRVIGTQDIIYDNKKVGVSVLYQFYL